MSSTALGMTDTLEPACLNAWEHLLLSSLGTLRQLAGATEREFLQIGNQMQGVYQKATAISETARHLVDVASGTDIHTIMARLRQILKDMERYLDQAKAQSTRNCRTLDQIQALLNTVGSPLESVKKMSKHLYIFEVSIKIESAYLGDTGSEFVNLALDIKKLSHQIKEKIDAIHSHRSKLIGLIAQNRTTINDAESVQDTKVAQTLENTGTSLLQLESVNERFFQLGSSITRISDENSNNISAIVQSMQFHDIFRQQIEHVVEALEGLVTVFADPQPEGDDNRSMIGKIGDVCELQDAQVQFASEELYAAVGSIVSSLRDIDAKQIQMAQDIYQQTSGDTGDAGACFVENVSDRMSSVTSLLTTCAQSNAEMAALLKEVAETVLQITSYVSDIEEIGKEVIQIALNARIKASCAGKEGASLSVLAGEIGQLSNEAVQNTDLITATLTEVNSTTRELAEGVEGTEAAFARQLADMNSELDKVLASLGGMGRELFSLLAHTREQVDVLTREIEKITGGICVHERARTMAGKVLADLKTIFDQARALQPASSEFKNDLRQMATRYTMESERRIHENIAGRHGVQTAQVHADASGDASEFGENVDLF